MKDFFDTWKFKILIAIAVFLVGIMAYAGANGRLTAAPQELLSVAVAPFQRAAAKLSGGVASLWENYADIDAILEENKTLTEENAALRAQMVDYDKLIESETGIDVHVAEDPLDCVAKGAGAVLDHVDVLHDVLDTDGGHM